MVVVVVFPVDHWMKNELPETPYPGNGVVKIPGYMRFSAKTALGPQCDFCRKSHIVNNGMRQLFFCHCNSPLSDATECIVISTSGFTWPV